MAISRKRPQPAARDYPDKLATFVEDEWSRPSDDEDPRLRTFNRKCRWIMARAEWANLNLAFDMDSFAQEIAEPI